MSADNPYPREGEAPAPLAGVRVIDLTTPLGEMAGRVLADFGAEVIKVEAPDGCESRHLAPFDESGGLRNGQSLYWAALGRGKKSVALDLTCGPDRDQLLDLVRSADVLIESWKPGFSSALGIGYDMFRDVNPGLVYASITPFGQDGPLARAPAAELTIEAAGGLLSLQGDDDRPNIPVGYPQSAFHAGAQAACDVVIALYARGRSGVGQHLDVSAQAAMVWTLMNATGYPPNAGTNPPATCEQRGRPAPPIIPGLTVPRVWECADGYATGNISLAGVGPRTLAFCLNWMDEVGELPERLKGIDFSTWVAQVTAGDLEPGLVIDAVETFMAFLKTRSKSELQRMATRDSAITGAIYDVADLLSDAHLQAREYWREVGGYTHPGPFVRYTTLALADLPPAPSVGQHNALLEDLRPRAQLHGSGSNALPFEGLKVADFAWVGVGPLISKALADHGATVVHIESMARPDVLRTAGPFKDNVPGLDNAQFMANFNSSKFGLACNLSTPLGPELAWRVIDWADVVLESFVPGNMKRWGIDYESIRKRRPDIVMLSTCLRGQTGPECLYTGFGGQGAALAGLHAITGWPDRPPVGPWGAYTDFINPRFGIPSLVGALMHRERTGEGVYIDLAQTEAGIRFLEPLVLDYTVNGRNAPPAGHDSLYACPHGVFATEGEQRFIAIACETSGQWRALRKVASLALASFAGKEFDEMAARQSHKREIESVLGDWCAGQDAFALAESLRAAGVPAYAVNRPSDLYDDPQLTHRGFFITLDHAVMGPTPYDGHVTRFSGYANRPRFAAPALGEHTEFVLRDILGLDDATIATYAAEGVLV